MTACFRALSVGCAVPRLSFESAVHSVFRSAVNLREAGEGLLLTLLLSGEADLPQGIRLEAPSGFAFDELPIGTSAVCQDGVLTLGNSLIVDLRTGRDWKCDLSSLDADMNDPAVIVAWRHAWHALRERQARSGSVLVTGDWQDQPPTHRSLLDQHMDRAMRAILEGTANLDLTGMAGLGALVGLGTGLTPSGDDLLTGYLAGLWCATRRRPERWRFLSAVAQLVIQYSTRTNDISRTYLCLAARGQVSSKLVDLATVICKGAGSAHVMASADAAMQVGHTSGMESVQGLVLGLAAWDGARLLAWAVG